MRIGDFLAEQRVAFECLLHPPAYTAQKRAKYLHVPGRRVAKGVLLAGPRGYFLAVLPATHRVDTRRLAQELDGAVRLATDREVGEVFRDCEWGAVPAFGSLYGLPTVLDEELPPDAGIVMEGHSHGEAVQLLCRDFERLEQPRRLRFAHKAHPATTETGPAPPG
jgi:Ala-tRNA(Pro) deacylase